MNQVDRILSAPPVTLDVAGRDGVRSTLAGLDRAATVRQPFVHIRFGTGPEVVDRITRFFGPSAKAERDMLDALRRAAAIPYLVSTDLAGSRISLPFGTGMPNPLALAAVDDPGGCLGPYPRAAGKRGGRDLHLVTTINPLSLEDWHATY